MMAQDEPEQNTLSGGFSYGLAAARAQMEQQQGETPGQQDLSSATESSSCSSQSIIPSSSIGSNSSNSISSSSSSSSSGSSSKKERPLRVSWATNLPHMKNTQHRSNLWTGL